MSWKKLNTLSEELEEKSALLMTTAGPQIKTTLSHTEEFQQLLRD